MDGYDADDHQAMMSVITGHWVSQIARTLAGMGVPELLHVRARSAAEIAEAASTDPDATFRLLRAAVAADLVVGSGEGEHQRFGGTGRLDRLRVDAPDSLHHLARVWNAPNSWLPWGHLPEVVALGREQASRALGATPWEYFEQHADEAELFSQGVTELSAPVIREAVGTITVEPGQTIVDVGGATGLFVLSLLVEHPDAGIVYDLPHVMDAAQQEIERRGLRDRCQAVPGDFFDVVPTADVFLVKFVLHDWDDTSCLEILRRCRRAMTRAGRVVVVDMLCGPASDPGPAALMDLNMLVNLPGRERDEHDLDALLTAAGLRRTATSTLSSGHRLVEASAGLAS